MGMRVADLMVVRVFGLVGVAARGTEGNPRGSANDCPPEAGKEESVRIERWQVRTY